PLLEEIIVQSGVSPIEISNIPLLQEAQAASCAPHVTGFSKLIEMRFGDLNRSSVRPAVFLAILERCPRLRILDFDTDNFLGNIPEQPTIQLQLEEMALRGPLSTQLLGLIVSPKLTALIVSHPSSEQFSWLGNFPFLRRLELQSSRS